MEQLYAEEQAEDPPERKDAKRAERERLVGAAGEALRRGLDACPNHIGLLFLKANSQQRRSVPYAAVLYDEDGEAFTFTSPKRLTYVETPITVDHVAAGRAILKRGPQAGTPVVTVGSAELLGTAHGVEEE